jgi:hypothetical protein
MIWGETRSEIGGYGKAILVPVVTSGSLDRTETVGWRPVDDLGRNGTELHGGSLRILIDVRRGQN